MTKREAEEPLEDTVAVGSPAPKKVRIEIAREQAARNGNDLSKSALNGDSYQTFLRDEARDNNVPTVEDGEEEEALEEAELSASGLDLGLDEEQSALTAPIRQSAPTEGYTDLYLDTIKRPLLDFDFEKLCSVTLSNINVYACLVCGKYYQGRGTKSHAYFHALEVEHHVFINVQTLKVYVLPEGYEVKSKSLDDIKFVVDPRYSKEEVGKLDREPRTSWDLGGKTYIPGVCPPLSDCNSSRRGAR
jgi:U4/U6.U5 tri-snRNP-associated protein 2